MNIRSFMGLRKWKRHDMIQCVGGIVYGLVGFFFANSPPNPQRTLALEPLLRLAPMEVWGAMFMFVGTLAILSSMWPPFIETWGYIALTSWSASWAGAYLMSMIFGQSPWTNLSGFVIWALMAFLWWAISGLLNPDATGVMHSEDRSS